MAPGGLALMSMAAATDPLTAFLDTHPDASTLRTLAHAWESGGGRLAVGTVAVRLQFGPEDSAHTAATLHADSRLELARIILEHHGLDAAGWTHWSDEFTDFDSFDATAKFPTLSLASITATHLARLATGLRDLAKMVDA